MFQLCILPDQKFQPTLPARGATVVHFARMTQSVFQPTLPARGATARVCRRAWAVVISTHAPRTGSDVGGSGSYFSQRHFNPRSPHGERPWAVVEVIFRSDNFNPRSPHGERRLRRYGTSVAIGISTHAPRTGSDVSGFLHYMHQSNFNPRSPHGERRLTLMPSSNDAKFQPTLPARGATRRGCAGARGR